VNKLGALALVVCLSTFATAGCSSEPASAEETGEAHAAELGSASVDQCTNPFDVDKGNNCNVLIPTAASTTDSATFDGGQLSATLSIGGVPGGSGRWSDALGNLLVAAEGAVGPSAPVSVGACPLVTQEIRSMVHVDGSLADGRTPHRVTAQTFLLQTNKSGSAWEIGGCTHQQSVWNKASLDIDDVALYEWYRNGYEIDVWTGLYDVDDAGNEVEVGSRWICVGTNLSTCPRAPLH
jgi:hypothetical protein